MPESSSLRRDAESSSLPVMPVHVRPSEVITISKYCHVAERLRLLRLPRGVEAVEVVLQDEKR